MNLICETILDYYTYENKRIFFQIKATSKSQKYKNTCRCLSNEQWKIFDKEIKQLIASVDVWNDEKCLNFNIHPYINVKVQKSRLRLEDFYKCLSPIDNYTKNSGVDDVDYAIAVNIFLECVIDFQLENSYSVLPDSHEYEPQIETTSSGKLSSPVPYEPYTPSKKNIGVAEINEVDFLRHNEDAYSPKYVFDDSHIELLQNIPKYIPASIHVKKSSREIFKSNYSDVLNELIDDIEDKTNSTENCKELNSKIKKKSKRKEIKYIPPNQEFAVIDAPVYIPTPIEDSMQRKVLEIDRSIRKLKERSKTIDDRSALFDNANEEKQKLCKEQDRKDYRSDQYNQKVRKRSKTIDEITAEFSLNKGKFKLNNINEESSKLCKILEFTDAHNINSSMEKRVDINVNNAEKQLEEKSKKLLGRSIDNEFSVEEVECKKSLKTQTLESDSVFDNCEASKNSKPLQANDCVFNASPSYRIKVTESAAQISPHKLISTTKSRKENSCDTIKSLRRSRRSPSKTKRLIDEQLGVSQKKKSKSLKISPKNKELFGTDDDDDDLFENCNDVSNKLKSSVFETPVTKKSNKSSSSSSSSAKKKRNRDESTKCDQEKRDMSKWLSKKKSSLTSSDKETKKSLKGTTKSSLSSKFPPLQTIKREKLLKTEIESRTKSPSPQRFELPSKEEMDSIRNKTKLMQKENAKVRAELDKMCPSAPKEVEFLSLQNVPVDDILNTFPIYKSELDEIYENNRKIDYIKGHNGINHCFVIRLLQQNVQMKMLQKLTEVYSNTKSTIQATLFANALLPEWIIRVFMHKFKFTRQQAINQIKEQEEFKLHTEEQSDNSFMFE